MLYMIVAASFLRASCVAVSFERTASIFLCIAEFRLSSVISFRAVAEGAL